jgi:4'-phosphopantetheinyl transferase
MEMDMLLQNVTESEGIRRFYWIWTMKEAYTKALGSGLGFDFRRIEYDVLRGNVEIDGVAPKGWRFSKFELGHGAEMYVGVVAEFVGGDDTIFLSRALEEWTVQYDAERFVKLAIETLQ